MTAGGSISTEHICLLIHLLLVKDQEFHNQGLLREYSGKNLFVSEMEPNTLVEVTAWHKGPVSRDKVSLRLLPVLHPCQLLNTHCFNPQISETPDLRPEESILGQGWERYCVHSHPGDRIGISPGYDNQKL